MVGPLNPLEVTVTVTGLNPLQVAVPDLTGVIPAPLSLYEPDLLALAFGTSFTAGAIFIHSYALLVPVTATSIQCAFSGVPTGNCDMGIFDASFNLLGHTGAIAATTGLFTKP